MNKEGLLIKVNDLINAPSVCAEAKEAAQNYLEALGTENEESCFNNFIEEIKQDIIPVDQMVAFLSSDKAKDIFGEEKAKAFYEHSLELQKAGTKYCDCPACSAVESILNLV